MKSTEQDFAERWRSVVRHLRDGAERLRATADEIRVDPDPGGSFTRHMEAFADYTVALNCLHALIAECADGRAVVPSA